MTTHLIIASYDGIATHYCGVGTIIRNTIGALQDLTKHYDMKVSLAYISTDKNGKVYDASCDNESIKLIKRTGGSLIPLCNGTSGKNESDMWMSFSEWEYASASLASALNIILKNDERNVVMLHDTPFLLFSKFKSQVFDKNLHIFYIPHSTGINHSFGKLSWRKKRIEVERNCFNNIQKDNQSHIIASGLSFAKHLSSKYGIRIPKKNYLKNGLFFGNYKEDLQKKHSVDQLKQFDINIDRSSKLIFSWGRCSYAKGFVQLLDVWKEIQHKLPAYYLVLQTPNNSGEESYYQRLKTNSTKIPRTILINEFNAKIWKAILRCENTAIVCIPSLMDPNPHTPMEAKLFCEGMSYVIVVSEKDGVKDSFHKNECFVINPKNKKEFKMSILEAASITKNMMIKFNENNRKTIRCFDYAKNFKEFLQSFGYLN